MKKVAVTGGLSSGKTTVCRFFKHLGAYVVSADEIVHHVLFSNPSVIKELTDTFGPAILSGNEIDREKLASYVFSQPNKLRALEAILHPKVAEELRQAYELAKKAGPPLFVAEVPLLYEAGLENEFDVVVVVHTPNDLAKQRYVGKDFDLRSKRQLGNDERKEKANYFLDNSGTLDDLKTKAKELFQSLSQGV